MNGHLKELQTAYLPYSGTFMHIIIIYVRSLALTRERFIGDQWCEETA